MAEGVGVTKVLLGLHIFLKNNFNMIVLHGTGLYEYHILFRIIHYNVHAVCTEHAYY
jgi:hypothetical protein